MASKEQHLPITIKNANRILKEAAPYPGRPSGPIKIYLGNYAYLFLRDTQPPNDFPVKNGNTLPISNTTSPEQTGDSDEQSSDTSTQPHFLFETSSEVGIKTGFGVEPKPEMTLVNKYDKLFPTADDHEGVNKKDSVTASLSQPDVTYGWVDPAAAIQFAHTAPWLYLRDTPPPNYNLLDLREPARESNRSSSVAVVASATATSIVGLAMQLKRYRTSRRLLAS